MSVEAARGYSCTRQPARALKAVQRPTAHLIPAQMYRENSPRLRFSAYSSLNVDTEK